MDKLITSGLKRNPEVIKSYFKISGNIISTTKDIKIIFPERYIDKELAILDTTIKIVAIYAIVDDENNYAVVSAPIYHDVNPYNINDISIDDVTYKELSFRKGDIVISNRELVMNDSFMYDLFDEFYIKGNVPWFLGYEDMANMLLETKKYANSNIGKNPLTMEIIASLIARVKDDKNKFIRQSDITNKNRDALDIAFIGLNNIYYSFSNTGAKLVGGYFGYGVTSAIVSPEETTSKVSKILRA